MVHVIHAAIAAATVASPEVRPLVPALTTRFDHWATGWLFQIMIIVCLIVRDQVAGVRLFGLQHPMDRHQVTEKKESDGKQTLCRKSQIRIDKVEPDPAPDRRNCDPSNHELVEIRLNVLFDWSQVLRIEIRIFSWH